MGHANSYNLKPIYNKCIHLKVFFYISQTSTLDIKYTNRRGKMPLIRASVLTGKPLSMDLLKSKQSPLLTLLLNHYSVSQEKFTF